MTDTATEKRCEPLFDALLRRDWEGVDECLDELHMPNIWLDTMKQILNFIANRPNLNLPPDVVDAVTEIPGFRARLHDACERSEVNRVAHMLKVGWDPNEVRCMKTPLLLSLDYRVPTEIVSMLLNAGADPNLCTSVSGRPLTYALQSDAPVSTVYALLRAGADPEMIDDFGVNCFNDRSSSSTLLLEVVLGVTTLQSLCVAKDVERLGRRSPVRLLSRDTLRALRPFLLY